MKFYLNCTWPGENDLQKYTVVCKKKSSLERLLLEETDGAFEICDTIFPDGYVVEGPNDPYGLAQIFINAETNPAYKDLDPVGSMDG